MTILKKVNHIKRNKMKITETQSELLHRSVKELVKELSANADFSQVKQMAFGYYNQPTKENFEIQITVTRIEDDFMDPISVECYKIVG